MATPTSYTEKECFNVFWKIKNFSYCCGEITSPEFSFRGITYWVYLHAEYENVECELHSVIGNELPNERQISFLTCDGSQEELISSGLGITLQVPKNVFFGNKRSSFLPEDTLTVICRFPTDSERGKLFIYSQIGVKRKYFLWTLKDFSRYQGTTHKSVEISRPYGDIELILKPMGGLDTDEKFYVEIVRIGGEKCYCTLKMSVLDVNGKAVNEVSDEFVLEMKGNQQTRGFPVFFKKRKLLACKRLVLPNDTLSLKCNFAMSLGTLIDQTALSYYCEEVAPLLKEFDHLSMTFEEKSSCVSLTELQTDLKSLLDEGTLFDASLQIGTEVIQVHKTILSARSAVFKAMFTKDMRETISNTVVIEDLDIETMRRLVLYMYTDSVPDHQWENIKRLYSAADKYEVLSLKKKCVSFLKTSFTVSNVCEALVLADLHQDSDLQTAAFDFISENDALIFSSEVWKELEKKSSFLALQVMREIYCNRHISLN